MLMTTTALALKPEIRLYKIDKKQKLTKAHYLFGKGDEPGCHNLPFGYGVFRVTVVKFESCSVFSEKDCQPESILPAWWKGRKDPVTRLTRGSHWYLDKDKDNIKVASWSCE